MSVDIHEGDCIDVFRGVRGLRAIVSDLPAGIGMMQRQWDRPPKGTNHRGSLPVRSRDHERRLRERDAFVAYWAERLAVGYDACADDAVALIWALPRTAGWTQVAMEDAGWRVVDSISHLFGQGWPKTPGVLKPAREDWIVGAKGRSQLDVNACRVPRNWDERGEAWLRSGHSAKPEAAKITGAPPGNGINADPRGARPANVVLSHAEGCVLRGAREVRAAAPPGKASAGTVGTDHSNTHNTGGMYRGTCSYGDGTETIPAHDCLAACDCGDSWLAPAGGDAGRCPACGAAGWWACPVAEIDAQSGECPSGSYSGVRSSDKTRFSYGRFEGTKQEDPHPGSTGGASRFFNRFTYVAKCPSGERHAGCDDLLWAVEKARSFGFRRVTRAEWLALPEDVRAQGNVHPTVKRLALMRWLHALAGPGRIGDLAAGSFTGAIAAHLDGREWIGADVCPEAIAIGRARLAWWRGISHEAAREFLLTDVVPAPPAAGDERQLSMLGALNA